MLECYSALSAVYDRLMADADYEGRATYIWTLFKQHGGAPESILDLGCGTGQLTALLRAYGADVIGADVSPEMLALARARLGGDTLLLLQDMRKLDLYGTVAGAVCTLDGMNHLLSTADIAQTLARLALFIQPGGRFIFDVNTPYKHREVLGNYCFVLEDDGIYCIWRSASRRQDIVRATLDIFTFDGKDWSREEDMVEERAYSLRSWQRLLENAGFSCEAVYGDRTFMPPTAQEERWVLVARRNL